MRSDGRAAGQLRPCTIEPGYIGQALGWADATPVATRNNTTQRMPERSAAAMPPHLAVRRRSPVRARHIP